MIILAIDSGIEKTGFAFFKKSRNLPLGFRYITSGLIKTQKKDNYSERIYKIYARIKELIKIYKPQKILLEQIFFFKNQKTAIAIGQAQGIIHLLAAQNNIDVEFLTPLQIKQTITGYGRCDKKAIQKMVNLILKPALRITQDDVADAIACGLAYCYLKQN